MMFFKNWCIFRERRSLYGLIIVLVIFRLPAIFQELPPFQFCDESIFSNEVVTLYEKKLWFWQEFRSGGFNILPITIIVKIIGLFKQLTQTEIILIGRVFYLLFLAPLTAFAIYKISILITEDENVGLISFLIYIVSPYVYSISRYWYPDHYICAADAWLLYFLILYFKNKFNRKLNCLFIGAILGVCLSIKYTSILLIAPISVFFIFSHSDVFLKPDRIKIINFLFHLLIYFVGPCIMSLIIFNYPIFFNIEKFKSDFNYNIINYGQRDFSHFSGIFYYLATITVLPFTLFGPIIMVYALPRLYKNSFVFLVSFFLFLFVFLLAMGPVKLVINRNTSLFLPFVIPVLAIAIRTIWVENNRFLFFSAKYLVLIMFLFMITSLINSFLRDFLPDSRVIAREWILENIPNGSIIGENEFCSGESPAPKSNYTLVNDPGMTKGLHYYVLNSYWDSVIFSSFKRKGFMEQIDQKYIHFYNINDRIPFKGGIFFGNDETLMNTVFGYKLLKIFRSNGPNIFIFKKE